MPRELVEIQHGTYRGAQLHYRRGEKPCDSCRIAKNEYQKEPDKRHRQSEMARTRRHRQAAQNAIRELIQLYPKLYQELYRVEYMKLKRRA